jgi:hypothetical protein
VNTLRRILLLASLLSGAVAGPVARADGYLDDFHPYQTYWAAGWAVGIPTSTLRSQWVDSTGVQGADVAARVGVLGRLAVGIAGSWDWFDKSYSSTTVQTPDFTFTGPLYRRMSATTAKFTVHYYLTKGSFQPFVGAGIGLAWLSFKRQASQLDQTESATCLTVSPEFGLLYTIVPRIGLSVTGRYTWTQAEVYGVRNPSWVNVIFGIAYFL